MQHIKNFVMIFGIATLSATSPLHTVCMYKQQSFLQGYCEEDSLHDSVGKKDRRYLPSSTPT